MNKLELSYLADDMDEDAIDFADYELEELLRDYPTGKDDFKSKYLDFYDDIKLTPYDDW